MNSSKLTQVHVYIIGGVLMLLLGVGLYFTLIKPVNDENVVLAQSVQGTEGTSVSVDNQPFNIMPWPGKKTAALEQLKVATDREAGKAAILASREAQKQVPGARRIDLGDGSQGHLLRVTMPRWLNLPQYVVQMMGEYSRSRAYSRGVIVTTNFKAPAPSTDPNSIPRRVIAWNLGPVTATGEFNKVLQWAEDWNSAPLLVALDGLKCSLAGRNGWVTATANLTVYVFPTGEAVTNAPAGAAPGAAGDPAGGAGGYPGAGGGGYPGGAAAPGGGSTPSAGGPGLAPAPT